MIITFHGTLGTVAGVALICLGAGWLINGTLVWLEDRVTRDGWRFRRRWDRPGAEVLLPDGRAGAIQTVYRGEDAGLMAVVIFEDAEPEWAPVASLSPAPAVAQEVAGV